MKKKQEESKIGLNLCKDQNNLTLVLANDVIAWLYHIGHSDVAEKLADTVYNYNKTSGANDVYGKAKTTPK